MSDIFCKDCGFMPKAGESFIHICLDELHKAREAERLAARRALDYPKEKVDQLCGPEIRLEYDAARKRVDELEATADAP